MQWKIVGVQFAALLIIVIVALKLLAPENSTQKSLDSRLQAIEDRLEKMDKNLAGADRNSLSSRPPSGSRGEKQSSNLSLSSDALPPGKSGGKPADMGQSPSSPRPAPDSSRPEALPAANLPPVADMPTDIPAASTPLAPKGSMRAFDSFFDGLPAEKRSSAEGIFQSHLESLRYKIDDAAKQGSSPQELNRLIYDDQTQIREEMKQVLTDQEYKAFLDAAPSIPKPN